MPEKHPQLTLKNLHVAVVNQQTEERTLILRGVDLTVRPGEVHAIMGPNGSGKSTLAYTLAGHPFYEVEEPEKNQTQMVLDGDDILEKSPDERAAAGLFLAFQYPVEVPGVKVQNFLRLAYNARFAEQPEKLFPTVLAFRKHLESLAAELKVNPELLRRGLNEGFSGGEKKRVEILQMAVLEPKYAILDETDSGLDVDAIKAVAEGVEKIRHKYNSGIVVITHYQRILKYLKPDFVHVMKAGKIVKSGGAKLAEELESQGFEKLEEE
ncbi:Fe-S cluster assembly ATPase SufC [Patescibacteria group bacterium]|nr:Fe-S cluster assembly ATPase SufC [Patescibacteria group bacterium]